MTKSKRTFKPYWLNYSQDKLLDLRICDLDLEIKGSVLERRIALVYKELERKHFVFRPHFWLSDEWFSPDGVPGVAIPFYLAHPRLVSLERSYMFEVEGGSYQWCMKILRHEIGHALDNAYGLKRLRSRQAVFGKSSVAYPEFYAPKPYSKSFVLHLDSWYAQSHPDEDFAETFAVWFTPDYNWRQRYAGWPALKKLEFLDSLMKKISRQKPKVRKKQEIDPISKLRMTLREHYKNKLEKYGQEYPDFYDRDLRKIFSANPEFQTARKASSFIKSIRNEVRASVANWTGTYQHMIDQVLEEIIYRCDELNLRLAIPEESAKVEFTVLLSVQTMNYLHSGRHRLAL